MSGERIPLADHVADAVALLAAVRATEPVALESAMRKARSCGVQVATHAIGDQGNRLVLDAYQRVLGDAAKNVTMSSTKSSIGHLLGAAGAVEAIFCILAIRDQICPPTINLDEPDEGCDLDFVPHQAKAMPIEIALSNSFGFGGTNGSLLFRRYHG